MWRNIWSRVAVYCVASVAVGLLPLWADNPASVPPTEIAGTGKPRIEFDTMEHDFGEKLAGDDLKTIFRFKNAGDGVLVIEKVKGG